jgi:predicted NAD-dependent protein-ADP-ribosyltransferase YbiA (DUF1768 family)
MYRAQLVNNEVSPSYYTIVFVNSSDGSNIKVNLLKLQDAIISAGSYFTFQSQKFSDPILQEKIRLAASPSKAKSLGKTRDSSFDTNWNKKREDVLYKGLQAKFQQHLDLKEKLVVWQERFAHQLPTVGTGTVGQTLHTLFEEKALNDAQQVLGSLGYETAEITEALLRLTGLVPASETQGLDSEGLLKAILKQLH